jgi:acyl carrier protein
VTPVADSTTTRPRVVRAVSQIMGVPENQVTDSSSPDSVEPWDSLRHMNLVLALEEEFGVKFSDEQIMTMSSVGRIIAGIDELLS